MKNKIKYALHFCSTRIGVDISIKLYKKYYGVFVFAHNNYVQI